MRVALLLQRHRFGRPVVVAGLLHDVVEDCDVDLAVIRERFGDAAAALVDLVTERETSRPWRARKQAAIDRLPSFSSDGAALKAADAVDNLRSMLVDHARVGDELWQRFNAPPGDQAWYYRAVHGGIAAHIGDHAMAQELGQTVAEFESVVRYAG
jgi:(p)ppGpp synthase/HD superfamily hydrolase